MSGGVDSSVAALLLKKRGYAVEGIFMRFWSEPGKEGRKNLCCSYDSQLHVQAVSEKLNIKLKIINLEKEFKKEVVDYFLREYKAGRTPNPCVKCNQFIKFNLPGVLASGHYAIIKNNKLYRAKDKTKDQSYFLYNLTQKQLKNIIFPVGNYTKSEVKAMAKKYNLPCRLDESFDICFIGGEDHNEFLKRHLKLKPGPIKFKNKVIGSHQGLALYTIGQRAGLGGGLFYVLQLDTKNNALIVTDKDKDLYSDKLEVENIHWINEPAEKCLAQIRYGHPAIPCLVKENFVFFSQPQRAITPGQSVVFYQQDEVLGGGIIRSANSRLQSN